MDVPVNLQITLEDLISLENKIIQNKDSIDDYKKIDSFLSKWLPPNYFLNVLQREGITSFLNLELFRRNPPTEDPVKVGKIRGTILGLLNFLKNQVKQ